MESFGQNYILTGDSKPEPIVDGSKAVSLGVSDPILICNFSSELFQSYSSLWERSAWINKGLNWQSKKRWGLATLCGHKLGVGDTSYLFKKFVWKFPAGE